MILAAGQGTRMRARLSKLLHPVAGLPMVRHVVEVCRSLRPDVMALVVGREAEAVAAAAGEGLAVVHQTERLGTGHAVLQARDALRGRADRVVVIYADSPLMQAETLERMLAKTADATEVLLTYVRGRSPVHDQITAGFGRIDRDRDGRIVGILELPETERFYQIDEVNTGAMACRADWLWKTIGRLTPSSNGELLLTDLVAEAVGAGHRVEAVHPDDPDEILGVNTQAQLATVNRIVLDRLRATLLDSGVRMPDPSSVYLDSTVRVEPDTVLHPNTHLRGGTVVGRGSEIGPNSIVEDSRIGENCRVVSSVLEGASVGNAVTIGPFAHLRPGAQIEDEVELGNYAEVKASTVGTRTRIHHFSYIGDAALGADTNVGAGTITCNYDGINKHRTVVGEGVFLGSDTMLIAPVSLGDGARTGAGSVVNRDVPPGEVVVGVPARPIAARKQRGDSSSAPGPPATNGDGQASDT